VVQELKFRPGGSKEDRCWDNVPVFPGTRIISHCISMSVLRLTLRSSTMAKEGGKSVATGFRTRMILTHKGIATNVDTIRNVKCIDVTSRRTFMIPKLDNMSVGLKYQDGNQLIHTALWSPRPTGGIAWRIASLMAPITPAMCFPITLRSVSVENDHATKRSSYLVSR
jgi:hypothetical protein